MKNRYKMVMFDLDDTLIDYGCTEKNAINKVYQEFFKEYISFDIFFDKFKYINLRLWQKYRLNQVTLNELRVERFQKMAEIYNGNLNVKYIVDTFEKYLYLNSCLFNDTTILLDYLKEKYILCLITDGISKIQRKKLEQHNLFSYFNHIVISEEVEYKKPSKEIFLYALSLAKVGRKETVMIGNSLESDFVGSINARIDFFWLNRENDTLPRIYPRPKKILKCLYDVISIL
jgi:YjjG family noncanonical pyrimidine nucleotidase